MRRALVGLGIVGGVVVVLPLVAFFLLVTVGDVLGLVKEYRIPSSAMEPTLHCPRPATGCEGGRSDRILVARFWPGGYSRGDIVAIQAPPRAEVNCGVGGTFVKRIVGLPGERLEVREVNGLSYVFVDGRKLSEPYIALDRRFRSGFDPFHRITVPKGRYFMLGDNRQQSCDSRAWGSLPGRNIIGKVFMTYWPLNRIGFR